jgi:hypothetical protein
VLFPIATAFCWNLSLRVSPEKLRKTASLLENEVDGMAGVVSAAAKHEPFAKALAAISPASYAEIHCLQTFTFKPFLTCTAASINGQPQRLQRSLQPASHSASSSRSQPIPCLLLLEPVEACRGCACSAACNWAKRTTVLHALLSYVPRGIGQRDNRPL